MTYSKLITRTITTPNSDPRVAGTSIGYIVLHHFAGTDLEGVLNSWRTGSKQGSANYAVGNEGQIVGVVPEERRSWSLSSSTWDSKAITFEIENQSTNGWTVSDAAEEAVAKVVADLCTRYKIPCDRTYIMGHREVYTRYGAGYATACPGGLEMDKIVTRAKAIIAEAAKPPVAEEISDMYTVQQNKGGDGGDQALKKGKATTLRLNKLGEVSIAVGNDVGDTSVQITLEGLAEGEYVLVGLRRATYVNGKATAAADYNAFPVFGMGVRDPDTGVVTGTTVGAINDKFGSTGDAKNGTRIRIYAKALTDGVVVKSVQTKTDHSVKQA